MSYTGAAAHNPRRSAPQVPQPGVRRALPVPHPRVVRTRHGLPGSVLGRAKVRPGSIASAQQLHEARRPLLAVPVATRLRLCCMTLGCTMRNKPTPHSHMPHCTHSASAQRASRRENQQLAPYVTLPCPLPAPFSLPLPGCTRPCWACSAPRAAPTWRCTRWRRATTSRPPPRPSPCCGAPPAARRRRSGRPCTRRWGSRRAARGHAVSDAP